jgi:hypothetical protein
MSDWDPKRVAEEAAWLLEHPQFEQRPASIVEFLGPEYLNIESLVRPGLKEALIAIFGEEVNGDRIALFERAMITGAIGIGKTTFASIALPYMAHWVLCLKDPQAYFELLPGSRIAFMQMSTSRNQALKVVFGDIFARIKNSKWFVENYPYDPKFTNEIRFAKDIWILPGDSTETAFEGFNILAGILDEMDSHKETKDKDYADVGYDTIHSRIGSRFPVMDEDGGGEEGHKGLLICIGQMKKASGFAARKYEEFLEDPRAYVMRMTIWESFGWGRYTRKDGTRNSFWYDKRRKKIVPTSVVGIVENPDFIEIPNAYKKNFETNPEKALRDLAGIPPQVSDPFISMVDKITLCVDRWKEKYGEDSPVGPELLRPVFAPWFRGDNDPRRRHIHVDQAYSGDGDSLGFAMGHVSELVEVEDELKPFITFDCLARIRAHSGSEIMLSDVRRIIYHLKDDLHFRIYSVSMDGFQSTESMQQLQKRRFVTEYVSIDKSKLPYEDLREAIYEERIAFPPFMTYLSFESDKLVEIAVHELSNLQDDGKKVDHPTGGSKDVADAMAGVCYRLMGDRTYRKGVTSLRTSTAEPVEDDLAATGTTGQLGDVIRLPGGQGLKAPIPPNMGSLSGLTIPPRLQPRRR